MSKSTILRLLAAIAPMAFFLSCSQVGKGPTEEALEYAPLPATFTWMLPRTAVSVTVNYRLDKCDDLLGRLYISPTIQISNISEPDLDIGSAYPRGTISIDPQTLNTFWQDNEFQVKTNTATKILTYLGSKPNNQAGAIIGNLIGSASKLTAVVLGVPAVAGAPGEPQYCGTANAIIEEIKSLQRKLANPKVSNEDLKNIPPLITQLQSNLTITETKKFDPGKTPIVIDSKSTLAFIGQVRPSEDKLAASTWFKNPEIARRAYASSAALKIDIFLEFKDAFPLTSLKHAISCESEHRCVLSRVEVPKGTLFREVAYIPVVAYQESSPSKPVASKTLPFGQYGTPRTIQLTAKLFQQRTWALNFSDTGELTDATFTNKATGIAASTLLNTAAGGVNAVATEVRTAATLADPDTTRLVNENNAIKAQIDNIKYTKELNALLAN